MYTSCSKLIIWKSHILTISYEFKNKNALSGVTRFHVCSNCSLIPHVWYVKMNSYNVSGITELTNNSFYWIVLYILISLSLTYQCFINHHIYICTYIVCYLTQCTGRSVTVSIFLILNFDPTVSGSYLRHVLSCNQHLCTKSKKLTVLCHFLK